MSNFLDHLSQRVLLCDGAMGTQVQARNLDLHLRFFGARVPPEDLDDDAGAVEDFEIGRAHV